MARCYNCGASIPDDDRTLLCDKCKRILLPFVKLTSTSTTSSVRRLLANEKNLRNAGVSDSGMEYLLRICELNDRNRAQEKERETAAVTERREEPAPEPQAPVDFYQDVEIPADEPLRLITKPYGGFLPAAKIILIAAGALMAVWFIFRLISVSEVEAVAAAGAAVSFCCAYLADTAEKLRRDLAEIKKRVR